LKRTRKNQKCANVGGKNGRSAEERRGKRKKLA
jgi:hypothetical protein